MSDTPHTIRVRHATLDDVPAIARIHVEAWQRAYRGIMPDAFLDTLAPEQRIARWEREVSAPDDEMTVLVAEDATTCAVLGFCSVCPLRDPVPEDAHQQAAGEIHTMYVDGAMQGRGVGRRLIAAAEDVMRDHGFARGVLWMLAGNAPARAFYERSGWRADGMGKTVAYGDRQVREIRLGKDIRAGN